MENPFQADYSDQIDCELIKKSLEGKKEALKELIQRHQVFVFNLALKLTKSIEDAEDITQEVFIKTIGSLSQFKFKSRFRTWLYRITVNHFLNSQKKNAELQIIDFESYFNLIDDVPDTALTEMESAELSEAVGEIRINCTAGMLLCLERKQRIIYVLGEMFGIDHTLGAEIMGISKGNFRIQLMRARQDLYNWMNQRCGLVNKDNPCRCSKKTKGFIELGIVDPDNLMFNVGYKRKIYDLSEKNAEPIVNTIEELHQQIFKEHPFHEPVTSTNVEEKIFSNDLIDLVFNFNKK